MATEVISEEKEKRPPGGVIELNRDELLSLLSGILKKEHKKILHGRVRDEKLFKLRLDGVRCFAYLSSVYGSILRDKDLTEIERRLEALENAART